MQPQHLFTETVE